MPGRRYGTPQSNLPSYASGRGPAAPPSEYSTHTSYPEASGSSTPSSQCRQCKRPLPYSEQLRFLKCMQCRATPSPTPSAYCPTDYTETNHASPPTVYPPSSSATVYAAPYPASSRGYAAIPIPGGLPTAPSIQRQYELPLSSYYPQGSQSNVGRLETPPPEQPYEELYRSGDYATRSVGLSESYAPPTYPPNDLGPFDELGAAGPGSNGWDIRPVGSEGHHYGSPGFDGSGAGRYH